MRTLLEFLIEAGKLPFRMISAAIGMALLATATALQLAIYTTLHLAFTLVFIPIFIIYGTFIGFDTGFPYGVFRLFNMMLNEKKDHTRAELTLLVMGGLLLSPFAAVNGFGVSIFIGLPAVFVKNIIFFASSASSLTQSFFSGLALGWNFDFNAIFKSMGERAKFTSETLLLFPNTLIHLENYWGGMFLFFVNKEYPSCGFKLPDLDSDLKHETSIIPVEQPVEKSVEKVKPSSTSKINTVLQSNLITTLSLTETETQSFTSENASILTTTPVKLVEESIHETHPSSPRSVR